MIHYLFLGHFERDGRVIRFAKDPKEQVFRPVVHCPLDAYAVQTVLREVLRTPVQELTFPDDWMVWLEHGYLVGDKYTRNQEEIHFITRLVERTHCDIYDVGAHSEITLPEWLAVVSRRTKQTAPTSIE